MNIGDLWLLLRGDGTQLEGDVVREAAKAGDAAGKTLGERMTAGAKTGAKIFAGVVATGLAAATGQGIQLNEVLNELQTETSATGADWEAMQAVVRRENGRTTESLDEIAGATKAMRQDLGLTGAEIDKFADRFLDAGLVTKEGGEQIVKTADDIGDAYHVSVERSLDAIDQVIASQERWGGSIQDRLAQLPQLAKAVLGLGGDLDDANALLNVASASGLDYTEVQKAINAAVGKFKVPPSLKEIIGLQDQHKTKVALANEEVRKLEDELAKFVVPDRLREIVATLDAIEDPTARAAAAEKIYNEEVGKFNADPIERYLDLLGAIPDEQARTQRSIELFGPKAGPIWAQIARTVHDAGGNIESFNVGQDAARGKAEELARSLDAGPIRSLKLLGERVGALLADAGSNPLVTGIASLGTIFGGFAPNLSGKIATGIGKGIAGAFRIAARLPLVSTAVAFAADQAATLYLKALYAGDFVSGALKGAWGKVVGSSIVGGAIKVASDRAATLYLKALIAGDAFEAGMSAVWRRVATSAPYTSAIQFLGQTTAGRILSAIGTLAIPATVAVTVLAPIAQGVQDENQRQLQEQLAAALNAGTDAAVADAERHLAELERGARASHNDSWLNIILGEKAGFEAAVHQRVADVKDQGQAIVAAAAEVGTKAGAASVSTFGEAIATGAQPTASKVGPVLSSVISSSIAQAGPNWARVAEEQGRRAAGAVADGIKASRDTFDEAWTSFLDALKNVQSPAVRASQLIGRLISKRLSKGLDDGRPEVKARAEEVLQDTIDELNGIVDAGGKIGKKGMAKLRDAMDDSNPAIANAARAVFEKATKGHGNDGPASLPKKGTEYGQGLGKNLAEGIESEQHRVEQAASRLAGAAGDYLKISSPAKKGPWSTLGGPEGWGRRFVDFLTKGFADGIPALNAMIDQALLAPGRSSSMLEGIASPASPQSPSFALPSNARPGATELGRLERLGAIRVEHTITPEGAKALADAGLDSRQVGQALAEGVNASGLFDNLQVLQTLSGS